MSLQLLKQLCSYSIAVEESMRRNDLRFLFLTASASCCRDNGLALATEDGREPAIR